MAEKLFVEVIGHFDLEGNIMPYRIRYEDERGAKVTLHVQVKDVRQAASLKVGGQGMRYTVRMDNGVAYLFHEEGRWFMEAKRIDGRLVIDTL